MDKFQIEITGDGEEELVSVLSAISVIAGRLAREMQEAKNTGDARKICAQSQKCVEEYNNSASVRHFRQLLATQII